MRMTAFAENAGVRDQALKRFLREARALASVDSAHVVHVHDFGRSEDDEYYLVMDYIEGASLHDMLRRWKILSELALQMGIQRQAIEAAHKTGIIHRDGKMPIWWLPKKAMLFTPSSGFWIGQKPSRRRNRFNPNRSCHWYRRHHGPRANRGRRRSPL